MGSRLSVSWSRATALLPWILSSVVVAPPSLATPDGEDPSGAASSATKETPEREGERPRGDDGNAFHEEIVVTATRGDWSVERLPVSASVITREEILLAPGLQPDELLRHLPGVQVPLAGAAVQYPSFNTLSMRGLGGTRALVLLDGVPLHDPMFGFVNWNQVPLEGLERMEVVRGAGASLYGGRAMGGTVQLISRRLQDGDLSASLVAGSYGTWRLSSAAARALATGVTMGGEVRVGGSDGYHRLPAERRRPIDRPAPWSERDVRLRTDLRPAANVRGSIRAGVSRYELSAGTPLGVSERENVDLAASFEVTGHVGDLAATLFYKDQDFDTDNVQILEGGTTEYRNNKIASPSRVFGGSLVWSGRATSLFGDLTVGVDVRLMSSASHRVDFDPAGAIIASQDSGGEQDSMGVFLQSAWRPGSRLEVLVGARLDHWRNHSGFDRTSDEVEERFRGESLLELSPRLAVRIDLGDGLSARSAVYGAFNPPTLRDLYRSSSFRTAQIIANPDLGPERTTGGDVGLELRVPRLHAELNLFVNRLEDVITQVVVGFDPLLTLQAQNLGTARSFGAELLGEVHLSENWSVGATYTRTEAETVRSPLRPEAEGKRTPDVPRNSASARLTYRSRRGGLIALSTTLASRMFADAENRVEYGGQTLVDLSLSWPLGGGLTGTLAVTNVFNDSYIAEAVFTQRRGAPRQVRAGLRLGLGSQGPAAGSGREPTTGAVEDGSSR